MTNDAAAWDSASRQLALRQQLAVAPAAVCVNHRDFDTLRATTMRQHDPSPETLEAVADAAFERGALAEAAEAFAALLRNAPDDRGYRYMQGLVHKYVEDWTDSVRHLCLRCSYGAPHRHDASPINDDWAPDRNLGIAAQSRKSVMKLLDGWQRAGKGRHVDGVEVRECPVPEREDGHVWWREPGEREEPAGEGGSG